MATDSEVWVPDGMAFAVGDRVRIRISAECRLTGPAGSPAGDAGFVGHQPGEDGRLGIIRDPAILNPHMGAQGHVYLVRRDGPPIEGFYAGWYAASELIPLDDDTGARRMPSRGDEGGGAGA